MTHALICIATTASGVFHRAGRRWTREGTLIVEGDLTDAELKQLADEPHLKLREATEEEVARLQLAAVALSDDAVIERLIEVITAMPAEDFTAKGLPDLAKLRTAAALEAEVTSEHRDAAMDRLLKGGFKPP